MDDRLRAELLTRVDQANARPGDIMVRGGHAGIFLPPNGDGKVWGYANNGYPAYAGRDTYRDRETKAFDFSPVRDTQGRLVSPQFFRPLIPIACGSDPGSEPSPGIYATLIGDWDQDV